MGMVGPSYGSRAQELRYFCEVGEAARWVKLRSIHVVEEFQKILVVVLDAISNRIWLQTIQMCLRSSSRVRHISANIALIPQGEEESKVSRVKGEW